MKNIVFMALLCLITFTSCSKSGKTIANLREAIIGETTASVKYATFAQEAAIQGDTAISHLFKATSISEAIHAANHKKALLELGEDIDISPSTYDVKSTTLNLQNALEGETYEVVKMYPQFISEVNRATEANVAQSLQYAFDTEKKHQILFTKALEAIKNSNTTTLTHHYMVCPLCGNTYEKEGVDNKCAFCQTSKDLFVGI